MKRNEGKVNKGMANMEGQKTLKEKNEKELAKMKQHANTEREK